MRVASLGSGSSGNALLVEAGPRRRTKLLIDAGLSSHFIVSRLRRLNVHPSQLQGVLLTHEHSDHVIGLPTLMIRYSVPVVADPRTYQAVKEGFASGFRGGDTGVLAPLMLGGELDDISIQELEAGGRALSLPVGTHSSIEDIVVESFPTSHDAVSPCGYLLSAGGCRVCVVIDSGEVTPTMLAAMQQADLLILEANHDRERLLRGPYPQSLKRRILSATGHLSNDQAADAVLRTWRPDGVRWLWLSHLSRTNNTPMLALKSVRARLQAANANLAQLHISVSPPGMGAIWDSTQLWHSPSLWDMHV
jgi:phosphoribosyl 1,2-cyclic phosphodiesterase